MTQEIKQFLEADALRKTKNAQAKIQEVVERAIDRRLISKAFATYDPSLPKTTFDKTGGVSMVEACTAAAPYRKQGGV